MRFSAGKDYNNSSTVVESCEKDKAGVRESVQPSRAEGKVVFAKAEMVGMRRAVMEGNFSKQESEQYLNLTVFELKPTEASITNSVLLVHEERGSWWLTPG